MVGIASEKTHGYGSSRSTDKHDIYQQTTRIIQWLGGERAGRMATHVYILHAFLLVVDVPAEFDVTSSFREDLVDHQIIASKVECIELLRLKPLVRLVRVHRHSCLLVSQFKSCA